MSMHNVYSFVYTVKELNMYTERKEWMCRVHVDVRLPSMMGLNMAVNDHV